ncbi:MAG: type pantothenate kinase [Bacteroidetes bacterium]|jgi:type III pantothenate kinase|nr:type pantothenate kinase [Bacteroidota bacterium]
MNLIADFGNTRIKTALFENNTLISKKTYDSVTDLINDKNFYSRAQNVVIGSVVSNHTQFMNSVIDKKVLLFEASTPIPLKNLYKSALTLGSDRIAASIGSYSLYPNRNVLTIDAGTCIKYNFVNRSNEYLGGAISPGLPMRLKAMNHFTNKLPLVEIDFNYEKLTGQSTHESILSGALLGAAAEVEETINRYNRSHENLAVVITGGDSPYLCKQLKNRIFAHPDIVLSGLNTILNYNIEE